MGDSSLQFLREKYLLQLYQDSFSHIVRLFKDELVLPDVEPGFPDLHDDYKEPLLKDKTYTDFKTKKEKLVDQWNQHIQCAKKAKEAGEKKVDDCKVLLERIWDIRRSLNINAGSVELPSDQKNCTYSSHLKVLLALEKLIKSDNMELELKNLQSRKEHVQSVSKESKEENPEQGRSEKMPENIPDLDNDDIQTTMSSGKEEAEKTDQSQMDTESSPITHVESMEVDECPTQALQKGKAETTNEKELLIKLTKKYKEIKSDKKQMIIRIKQLEKELAELKDLQEDTHSQEDDNKRPVTGNTSFEEVQAQLKAAKNEIQVLNEENERVQAKHKSFKNLEEQLKETNEFIQSLTEENERIQAKYRSLKGLEDRQQKDTVTIQSLTEENERIQAKYRSLKGLEDQQQKDNVTIQSLTEENERIVKTLKLPDEKAKKMLTAAEKKTKETVKQNTDLQQKLQEQTKEKEKLSEMCDKYKAAYHKLQKAKPNLDERIGHMQRPQTAPTKQYREMQVMVETLKDEKESLMQRLSKVAGMKMKDNNPAIADLSDPNRPEKLSEKFREIYDNAWTNLLDVITETTGDSDEIGVKQIVMALTILYDNCTNTISNTKRKIAKLVGYPEDCFDKPYAGGKEGHDPVLKTLKDLIQVSVSRQSVGVTKKTKELPEIKTILEVGGTNGDTFITECLQLCLYMCTHDPPVVLDFSCKSGDAFDKDKFVPFTKSGAVVDYVVWPVMYLSDNGAIMSKGIAQGK